MLSIVNMSNILAKHVYVLGIVFYTNNKAFKLIFKEEDTRYVINTNNSMKKETDTYSMRS